MTNTTIHDEIRPRYEPEPELDELDGDGFAIALDSGDWADERPAPRGGDVEIIIGGRPGVVSLTADQARAEGYDYHSMDSKVHVVNATAQRAMHESQTAARAHVSDSLTERTHDPLRFFERSTDLYGRKDISIEALESTIRKLRDEVRRLEDASDDDMNRRVSLERDVAAALGGQREAMNREKVMHENLTATQETSNRDQALARGYRAALRTIAGCDAGIGYMPTVARLALQGGAE